ncbi:MAG: DUF4105 domain-containing protein [Planctomycetota bacterium]|nr:DUF4105 domain-containing protein [Planctomycetota bacterium]
MKLLSANPIIPCLAGGLPLLLTMVCGCGGWTTRQGTLPILQSVVQNDLPDRTQPSNQRKWSPQFSRLPTFEINGDRILVRNVRNNRYITEHDFVVHYEDREYDLEQIKGVDFLVCPFQNAEFLAHTLLSFEFEGDRFLAVSAEIRTENGEQYSPFLGVANQFEITYVVADEKDLIRLRTRHRDAEVYLYPTVASPQQARELFLDVMKRVNQLAVQPEFYHTVLNNCTTSIVKHVNAISPRRIRYNYSVLLPGLSAKYAHQLGLLDSSLPFEDLKQRSNVTQLSERFHDDPDYSLRIRGR